MPNKKRGAILCIFSIIFIILFLTQFVNALKTLRSEGDDDTDIFSGDCNSDVIRWSWLSDGNDRTCLLKVNERDSGTDDKCTGHGIAEQIIPEGDLLKEHLTCSGDRDAKCIFKVTKASKSYICDGQSWHACGWEYVVPVTVSGETKHYKCPGDGQEWVLLEEDCSVEGDEDLDGHADCQDPDCYGVTGPQGQMCERVETVCDDGHDNDGDGLIDGCDPDCPEGSSVDGNGMCCNDGIDNNNNGVKDNEESACQSACPSFQISALSPNSGGFPDGSDGCCGDDIYSAGFDSIDSQTRAPVGWQIEQGVSVTQSGTECSSSPCISVSPSKMAKTTVPLRLKPGKYLLSVFVNTESCQNNPSGYAIVQNDASSASLKTINILPGTKGYVREIVEVTSLCERCSIILRSAVNSQCNVFYDDVHLLQSTDINYIGGNSRYLCEKNTGDSYSWIPANAPPALYKEAPMIKTLGGSIDIATNKDEWYACNANPLLSAVVTGLDSKTFNRYQVLPASQNDPAENPCEPGEYYCISVEGPVCQELPCSEGTSGGGGTGGGGGQYRPETDCIDPANCFEGAEGDSDGDGILDDGDNSGSSTDNPCTGGQKTNCDDNCIDVANPNQEDADNDGIGNPCDDDQIGGPQEYTYAAGLDSKNARFICYDTEKTNNINYCCKSTTDPYCQPDDTITDTISFESKRTYPGNKIYPYNDFIYATETGKYDAVFIPGKSGGFSGRIKDWSWGQFTHLEFDISVRDSDDFPTLKLRKITGGEKSVEITNLAEYSTTGSSPGVWHHMIVPLSVFRNMPDGPQVLQNVDMVRLTTNDNFMLMDSFALRRDDPDSTAFNNELKYCTGTTWIDDLDPPQGATLDVIGGHSIACEDQFSFGWTGSKCCGDDQIKTSPEFYTDNDAGCWFGKRVWSNRVAYVYTRENADKFVMYFVDPDTNNKAFHACDPQDIGHFDASGKTYTTIQNPNLNENHNLYPIIIHGMSEILGSYYCTEEGWQSTDGIDKLRIVASKLYDYALDKSPGNYRLFCGETPRVLNNPNTNVINTKHCALYFKSGNTERVAIGAVIDDLDAGIQSLANEFLTAVDPAAGTIQIDCAGVNNRDNFFEPCNTGTSKLHVYLNKRFGVVVISQEPLAGFETTIFERIWLMLRELFARVFNINLGPSGGDELYLNEEIVQFNKLYIAQHNTGTANKHTRAVYADDKDNEKTYMSVETKGMLETVEGQQRSIIYLMRDWLLSSGETASIKSVQDAQGVAGDVLWIENPSDTTWQALTGWLRI